MDKPAQKVPAKVLLTGIGTILGTQIAQLLIKENIEVYGAGNKQPAGEIIVSPKFTFLDLDLTQPMPPHIPNFDTIIHITSDNDEVNIQPVALSTTTKKLAETAKETEAKLLIVTKITDAEAIFNQSSTLNDSHYILGIGHIFGPGLSLETKINSKQSYFDNNLLSTLISQAVQTDKIILENEGQTTVYPTYITDVVQAILKIILKPSVQKKLMLISSAQPQSALSISYEIQKRARLVLHKELGLYFAGEANDTKQQSEAEIKVHTYHESRYAFPDALEKTFEYFQSLGSVKQIAITEHPQEAPIVIKPSANETRAVPHISPSHVKTKKTVLIIAVLLSVICVKTGLNLYLGAKNLDSAKNALMAADFKSATESSINAQKNLSSAKKIISVATPLSESPKSAIESLELAALALADFSDGAKNLSENLSRITSSQATTSSINTEAPTAAFTKAHFQIQQAQSLASRGANTPFIGSKIQNLTSSFEQFASLTQTAQELTILLPEITGLSTNKNYLILLMNNTELRPGGGFIGSFGEISFENTKLKEIKVEDIYTIDGQLKEVIAPPPELTQKLGVTQLYLRDSNWSTDFRTNAQTARDFYKKETGKTVDGVIALDLTLIEKLLEKIGPIKLDDYDEEINHTNLFDKGEYYSEVGFFPGSSQKRDFFASLTRALLGKIIESLSTHNQNVGDAPLIAIVQTINEGLAQKHLTLSFDNPNLNAQVRSKNWDNVVPPSYFDPKDNIGGTRDFLALSEANIGANKVNRYIKREVAYDMTIGRDADLMATLTLTYKNESPADTWPGGTYVNYLRILTPLNSSIESYMEDGKKIELEQTVKAIKSPTIETAQSGELTQFAKIIEVPVKQTKTFTFKYRIPKNIKLETAPTYDLYISKQPGTKTDPLKFTFNLPAYLKIDSINNNEDKKGAQNHTIESDLTVDRHFQVRISKK